jgi:hypothetical protein
MKKKLVAAATKVWSKVKPWLQSKSKAVGAVLGGELALDIGALVSPMFGGVTDWNDVLRTGVTLAFTGFGITYFAPANKPLS